MRLEDEMAVVDYPSEALRAVPSFRFTLPDGWTVGEHPRVLAALRAPAPAAGFHANAMIATLRVDASTDLAVVGATSVARAAAAGSEPTLERARTGVLRGRPTYLQAVAFTAGEPARRIAQLHSFFVAPVAGGRAVADLFSVVGTCLADHVEEYGPVFVNLVASFEFAGGA